ncbi:succinate--CoA ligase subunit alpha [Desulfomonile tiedjei]|uniref:Succinate--CoA ligase [ADP-forming] subunit alpha n=1 Tax=Desulfomonile tiedjei (strain ATCC 49306 / DSM 6799 / DCB-1) TaxID=706587 RepID=I4CAU6_DESTA|nr:succinate--CoA ligase subunit alpha [Desulfomonile tiedjei]AFM26687.1 succinyl-CoA synthetase, alpha subunit [Desulfomonile tiedjei DSM 6799]
MAILVNRESRVICQGITGRNGTFHSLACREYGTNMVGGVTPGKGGSTVDGIPVFNTVWHAVKETGADVSLIFIPAAQAKDPILEAVDAGIQVVVCITEGIPPLDTASALYTLRQEGRILIGPNTPGIISPPESCKVGIMPGYIHKPGPVGVISRSGTLTYEVVDQLTKNGIGQSTCLGLGGDPVVGLSFVDVLKMFREDPATEAVVLIGEIGGSAEEQAAEYIKNEFNKPVAAYIAGRLAPPGKRMGHAGAIISGGSGTAQGKIQALQDAGVTVIENLTQVGSAVKQLL